MQVNPVVMMNNGIVSVTMQALFVGDSTDTTDKQRIQAYGDPKINLGGTYTDPSNPDFSFSFPASQLYAGITTQMASYTARFMTTPAPPPPPPSAVYQWSPASPQGENCQGALDCITSNPVQAATVWAAAIQAAVLTAMTSLRAESPASLTSLPDMTV